MTVTTRHAAVIFARAGGRAIRCCLFALMAMAWFAPSANALTIYERQGVNEDGQFTVTPAREEVDVEPGGAYRIKMTVLNHTGQDRSFELSVSDIEAAPEPDRFAQKVEEAKYGAKSWITPEVTEFELASREEAIFYLDVLVPDEPPVGSSYAALTVDSPDPLENSGDTRAGTGLVASGLAQLLFNVPGDVQRSGEITDASVSDRYFFRESVFGGGSSFVRFDMAYANTGNVTDYVRGEIVIRSMFGNAVKRYEVGPVTFPRDSERELSQLWTDVPMFGRFTATLELESNAGVFEEEFDTITILPPWWWIAILVILISVPVGIWWRNRSIDWEQYLDEDWDEEFDEAYDYDD